MISVAKKVVAKLTKKNTSENKVKPTQVAQKEKNNHEHECCGCSGNPQKVKTGAK